MRSALGELGIEKDQIEIEQGKKPFTVRYDPKKVDPEQMLAKLKESGEPAKLR